MIVGKQFKEYCVFVFLLLFAPVFIYADEISRDVLYLKNGATVHGYILEQVPNDHLKIQAKDGVVKYKMEEIFKMEKEKITVEGSKSPILACALSFFPGVGQYYNGQIAKGLMVDGLCLSGLGLALLSLGNPNYSPAGSLIVTDRGLNSLGGFMYLGSWLFSIIDAPISAADINAQRDKDKFSETASMFNGRFALGMNLGYLENSSMNCLPGGSVVLRF